MISGPSSPSSVLLKFLRDHGDAGVFDPHAVRILVAAFDGAWQSIKASGAKLSDKQIELVRENLAKYIIEPARNGELDQCRLRDGAPESLCQPKETLALGQETKQAQQPKQA
jgi:hypothetical protein